MIFFNFQFMEASVINLVFLIKISSIPFSFLKNLTTTHQFLYNFDALPTYLIWKYSYNPIPG